MNRTQWAAAYVAVTGVVLPMLLDGWGLKLAGALIVAVPYTALLTGCVFGKKWAAWMLFIVLVAQALCWETASFRYFANAGFGARIGWVAGRDLMASGIEFNTMHGYFAHFSLGRHGVRCVTDGVTSFGAVMVNVIVLPPIIMLWPVLFGKTRRSEPVASGNAENAP